MNLTIAIPPQRIADLMVTGIEGGIGYWARDVHVIMEGRRVPYGEASSYESLSWKVKGKMVLTDDESEWGDFTITPSFFVRRLSALGFGNQHLVDWLNENEDVETADALIQIAAFGEIVYG